MRSLVSASLFLLLMAGCQNQQSQINPFAVYGPQRLPPPGTQTYGQQSQTAPYYQGPAANQAPTIQGGMQTNPPAQFTPPANTAPTSGAPSSYGQGGWQKVGQSSSSSTSGVVQASHTQEISTTTPPANTTPSGSTAASSASTTTSSGGSNPYLRGMHVNEVSDSTPSANTATTPLAPPATSAVPSTSWSNNPAVSSSSSSAPIQPSRIP